MLNIFTRSGSARKTGNQEVSLVAFGKHPGWDDHIPDIGQMTARLIEVKRVLYVGGIGGSIDSGAWDRLEPDQLLDGFRHLFLWRTTDGLVVGRLWSSRDGKGRTKYPMIVCAHCRNLPLTWVLSELLPRFERIEKACAASESADVVVSTVGQAQREVQSLAEKVDPAAVDPSCPANLIARLADHADMGEDARGLMRILYQVDREVIGHRASQASRAKHIRVPAYADSPDQALLQWTQLLIDQFGGVPVPMLAILPLGESWVDIILGEQVGSQVSCMRVLPSKTPLTSDIPYNLDESFIEKAKGWIDASRRGESTSRHSASGHANAASTVQSTDTGSAKSAGLRAAIAFAVVLIVVLVGLLALGQAGLVDEKLNPAAWVGW